MRPSKRAPDELRKVSLERGVSRYAEGSCLVKFGETHVLCTASLEERGPPWLRGTGKGWVTAEYSMLPRATHDRTRREVTAGKPSGRTQEIQRLIGRSLRAVDGPRRHRREADHARLRRAAGRRRHAHGLHHRRLGGAARLHRLDAPRSMLPGDPLKDHVAAISCGISHGVPVLDLDYAEDSAAETDANFVMTGGGGIVEIQGTGGGQAVLRGGVPGADDARPQRRGAAGRAPEARRDVSGAGRAVMRRLLSGRVIIATHNAGKLREMRDLLGPTGWRWRRRANSISPSRRRPGRPSARTPRSRRSPPRRRRACPPSPTTAASAWPRSAASPASTPLAGPGREGFLLCHGAHRGAAAVAGGRDGP